MSRGRCVRLGLMLTSLAFVSTAHSQTLEPVGVIPGPAATVHLHESRAYLSDGPMLRIVDVGDPTNPTVLGSYTFPMNVYAVRVSESVAYAAVDFEGLGIVDVSDPTAPAHLGALETPGQAIGVAVSGTMAAVANRISGLELVDVSDPRGPVSRGASYVEGYAVDVDASGGVAYVVDAPGGLSVVNMAQSGDVTAESIQPTTENAAAVGVTTLRSPNAADRVIATVVSTESLLELFDVSTPSAPKALGVYRDPTRQPTSERPETASAGGLVRVRTQEELAFFTDAYPPYTLRVVDLSDPTDPTLVTAYDPPGFVRDVAVSDDLVFLALATGAVASGPGGAPGVLILRLSP